MATFFPPASASSENRRARIAVLERELETLRRDQADDDDGAWLQQLVAAVGTAVCFSAADLQQHAQVEPALRALLAGLDARRIGGRLAGLRDRDLAGLRLVRIARDERGCIWTIADTSRRLS